jgi:predicted NBD/HSP70 family sugar kinase
VEPGGLTCHCGQRGCLEAYCSTRRIIENTGLSLNDFFQAVTRHDPACEALWFDMLRHLAIGINNINLALDCQVILGGLLSEYLEPWLPELKRYVSAGNPFGEADFLSLSTLRRHIAPLGVALYFIREFICSV